VSRKARQRLLVQNGGIRLVKTIIQENQTKSSRGKEEVQPEDVSTSYEGSEGNEEKPKGKIWQGGGREGSRETQRRSKGRGKKREKGFPYLMLQGVELYPQRSALLWDYEGGVTNDTPRQRTILFVFGASFADQPE